MTILVTWRYHGGMTNAEFIRATENGSEVIDLTTLTIEELEDLATDAGAHGDHDGVEMIQAELATR